MKKVILCICVFFLTFNGSGPLSAEDDNELQGKLILSYRHVDTSGSPGKYKEDINLGSGARLMTLELSYNPKQKEGKWIDEAYLTLDNFGGDPFESFHFKAVKYGTYSLSYQRIKADYFYADEQWTHPLTFWQMRASVGGDFHTFDYQRVIDRASARIWLGKSAHFNFSFDRYFKKGNSTTTVDVFQEEFEVDKPINQESQQLSISFDFSLPEITFWLEEKIGTFKDSNAMFLPGFSEGEWSGYPAPNGATMSYYFLDMPYDTTSLTHTLRINARPVKNLLFKGAASLMNLKVDNFDYMENALGTNRTGVLQQYDSYDTAFDFSRKLALFDFDLSYLLNKRLALVASARNRQYDQTVSLATQRVTTQPPSVPSTTDESVSKEFNTFGFDLGAQYRVSKSLQISAGLRSESRTIRHEAPREDSNTSHLGLFANLAWKPAPRLSTTLDYQFGSYEDQVMPILPARMQRLRLNMRYQGKAFYAQGIAYYNQIDNNEDNLYNSSIVQDLNGFKSSILSMTFRLGHNGPKFSAALGWTFSQNKTTANDRRLNGVTPYKPWPIYFNGTMNIADLVLDYNLSEVVALSFTAAYYTSPAYYGGYVVYQDNNDSANSAQPSFTSDEHYRNRDLSRLSLRPAVTLSLPNGLIMGFSYRLVDFTDPFTIHYTDKQVGFNNDYQANVFELTLGYRWK